MTQLKKTGSVYDLFVNPNFDHSDGVDIYFMPNPDDNLFGAAAAIGGDPQLMLMPEAHETVTICHEMGHVLGLFHTFHKGLNDPSTELVSRTRTQYLSTTNVLTDCTNSLGEIIPCCERLGDRLCSTPASSRNYELCVFYPDCEFNASKLSGFPCVEFDENIPVPTDKFDDEYDIGTDDIMSYVDRDCRTLIFGNEQVERMLKTIEVSQPTANTCIENYNPCDDCNAPPLPCLCIDAETDLVWESNTYSNTEIVIPNDATLSII